MKILVAELNHINVFMWRDTYGNPYARLKFYMKDGCVGQTEISYRSDYDSWLVEIVSGLNFGRHQTARYALLVHHKVTLAVIHVQRKKDL